MLTTPWGSHDFIAAAHSAAEAATIAAAGGDSAAEWDMKFFQAENLMDAGDPMNAPKLLSLWSKIHQRPFPPSPWREAMFFWQLPSSGLGCLNRLLILPGQLWTFRLEIPTLKPMCGPGMRSLLPWQTVGCWTMLGMSAMSSPASFLMK